MKSNVILNRLRKELLSAKSDAFRVYEKNRDGGSSEKSVAFDSGRYDGLKQALEILDRMEEMA